MNNLELTKKNEVMLANTLKEIYYVSVVEEEYSDSTQLLQNIVSLVEENMKLQQDAFNSHPGTSLRFPSTHELAINFINLYQESILRAEKFAFSINSRFGYSIDLASVIAPYVLYQAGITDENISFYMSLGFVIANIICDVLAGKKEDKEDTINKKNIKTMCKELEKVLTISKKHADTDEAKAIDRSIEEINKIIHSDE